MSSLSAHRIGRLTWRVQAASTSAALLQRRLLRSEWESVFLPMLERVFDRFAGEDIVLRIPQLSLHVAAGNFTTGELAHRLEAQLSNALADLLDRLEHRSLPAVEVAGKRRPDAVRLSAGVYRRELLVEYLGTGRLDRSVSSPADMGFLAWLRTEAECFAADSDAFQQLCSGSMQSQRESCFRLLQLLTLPARERWLDEAAEPLARLVKWGRTAEVGEYWQLRWAAMCVVLGNAHRHDGAAQRILQQLLLKTTEASLAEIAETLDKYRTAVGDARQELLEWLTAIATPAAANAPTPVPVRSKALGDPEYGPAAVSPMDFLAIAVATDPTTPLATDVTPLPTDIGLQPEAARPNQARDDSGPPTDHERRSDWEAVQNVMSTISAVAETQPGRFAHDAGLILLHPFLARLFEAVGIRKPGDRQLLHTELPRAAALLHWLVSGRDAVFEFELTLCKVFIGLRPEDPLPVSAGLLNDAHRDEGLAVLGAVLKHWAVLRRTSIAGLRTSFLQRHGILRHDANGWRLRMETESYDLLLGQLPWEISVVKLPWMPQALFTEWPPPA